MDFLPQLKTCFNLFIVIEALKIFLRSAYVKTIPAEGDCLF
jgi:hypothetical protein